LPIDLLHFSGQRLGTSQAALHWTTASEINNAYFSIERSADAQNFSEIAPISSLGEGQRARADNPTKEIFAALAAQGKCQA
jgi:hypothetical protein